jgi:pantothenate synthetase
MQDLCAKGGDVVEALTAGREALDTTPGVTLEYLDVVDAQSFEPSRGAHDRGAHVVVAAHVQGVRLIDNAPLRT